MRQIELLVLDLLGELGHFSSSYDIFLDDIQGL